MNRISLKVGSLEVEYEGDQDFIESRLLAIVQELLELTPTSGAEEARRVGVVPQVSAAQNLSTNTIAQMIDARTGSDLVLAAIARIIVAKGRPSAVRHEILSEMKEATTYYKETYASNLSSYLDSLVKGKKANLVSKNNYSLPASERGRFEGLLIDGG